MNILRDITYFRGKKYTHVVGQTYGSIFYFFDGRSPSRHKHSYVFHLAGAKMKHFLERIAPLRHLYINPNEKSNKYKSSLLSLCTKALTEHFLQGNVPLRDLLNAKSLFMSWWRSAYYEVNDWGLLPCVVVVEMSSKRYVLLIMLLIFLNRLSVQYHIIHIEINFVRTYT